MTQQIWGWNTDLPDVSQGSANNLHVVWVMFKETWSLCLKEHFNFTCYEISIAMNKK